MRAETDVQKEEIIDRLLTLWKKEKYLRLGQLIGNIIRSESTLYSIEDYTLIRKLEQTYDSINNQGTHS